MVSNSAKRVRTAITPEQQSVFTLFMREHQHQVYTRAYRLLADGRQAEDVVQEVFLKAYQQGEALWRDPRVVGWLVTVARNLCFNHLTRYAKRMSSLDESTDELSDGMGMSEAMTQALTSREPDMHTQMSQAETQTRLQTALLALPDQQRIPLVLFHFEELSYEEIAKQLNISMAKLKTDIHRARSRLAAELKPLRQETTK